eukprot:jgi/Ulvmu1/6423/UM003_0052.1
MFQNISFAATSCGPCKYLNAAAAQVDCRNASSRLIASSASCPCSSAKTLLDQFPPVLRGEKSLMWRFSRNVLEVASELCASMCVLIPCHKAQACVLAGVIDEA